MTSLRLEFKKIKRKHFPLIVLGTIGLQCLWLLWSFRNATPAALAQGYTSCFYQLPIINAIILPLFISVLVSRLCDLEHKGHGLKALLPIQKAGRLFDAKFICTACYLFMALVLQTAIIYVLGMVIGFTDQPLIIDFTIYFISQFLVSLFVTALIQIVALKFVNQFIPLIVGLISGFLGLTSMFFPGWLMRFVPSAYYGLLSNIQMDWNRSTRVVTYFHGNYSVPDFILIIGMLAIVYLSGRYFFTRREV